MLRAIKFISKNSPAKQLAMQEANLLKNLQHPCIPIIYDIEEDEYNICIIEEYAVGKSITNFMKDNMLSSDLICRITIQLCDVLSYMHNSKGVFHLDLKPNNIIIDNKYYIKLIDYGNALYEGQERENCIGTKGFASPEQYFSTTLNNRSDIYSVGMLLLYMSTNGYMLSGINNIHQKQIKQIIKKCTRHNIWQRYNNINQVKEDVTNIVKNKKISKDVQSKSKPLVINIAGIKPGIGVTHFALAFSKYLNSWGIRTLCTTTNIREKIDYYIDIIRGETANYTGIYEKNGTYLLPDFNNYVKYNSTSLSEYEVIIKDIGVYSKKINYQNNNNKMENITGNKSGFIIVGGGKYYERNLLLKCLNQINDENAICVFNHISGMEFYEYMKHNELTKKVYRMPYICNWSDNSEILFDMFQDIIQDNFEQLNLLSNTKRQSKKVKILLRRSWIYNKIKNYRKLFKKK